VQTLESFKDLEIFQGCILVTNDLHILGVPIGSQGFVIFFLDEILSQDVAHINDLLLLGNAQVALGILFSCVAR
jgi:hypothetical protein